SKGIANDTFGQLNLLAEKDAAAGAQMASQLTSRLLAGNFSLDGQTNYQSINFAQALLNHFASQNNSSKLRLDPGGMRDVAIRLIRAFVEDQNVAGSIGTGIIQIAQRFAPASVSAIKSSNPAIFVQNQSNNPNEALFQRLMQNETSVDEMLSQAEKLPSNY